MLGGPGRIDLSNAAWLERAHPLAKRLGLSIMVAIKTYASELRFEPGPELLRSFIVVDGTSYESVPEVKHATSYLTQAIRAIAGLGHAPCGSIQVLYGERAMKVAIEFEPIAFGEKVVLRFPPSQDHFFDCEMGVLSKEGEIRDAAERIGLEWEEWIEKFRPEPT